MRGERERQEKREERRPEKKEIERERTAHPPNLVEQWNID